MAGVTPDRPAHMSAELCLNDRSVRRLIWWLRWHTWLRRHTVTAGPPDPNNMFRCSCGATRTVDIEIGSPR